MIAAPAAVLLSMDRTLEFWGKRIIFVGWLAFLASFFLPATNILQAAGAPAGTPLTGWQAFTTSLSHGAFNIWAWFGDVRVFLFLVFPITNGIMIWSPAFGALKQGSFLLALILLPAAMVPWLLPHNLRGDFFIGFYAWNASYVLVSIGSCLVAASYSVSPKGGLMSSN